MIQMVSVQVQNIVVTPAQLRVAGGHGLPDTRRQYEPGEFFGEWFDVA